MNIIALLPLVTALGQSHPQTTDTTYQRLVAEATTDDRFLTATVATIPSHPTVPSPLEHFGSIAGAPGIMHRVDELYTYYLALAEATPRVAVETVGHTEGGRDIILVVIADQATMASLDRIKDELSKLADPRTLDQRDLERTLANAKPVYYVMGGLHSPEMGPPEMLPELAYRLAVSEKPMIRRIRENVVTIINPVAEPDGRDRQVDWYYRYTKGRETLSDRFPRSVPYWGNYVYHDNNRDGIQISQELTKAIYRVYYDWHPTVMHDLHESVPLLYASTGTGPYNRTVDPITISEWQTFANWDVQALTQQGVPGVWSWAFYDGWWPGYAIWIGINHNSIGRFYETFGNSGADTYLRDLRRSRYAGDSVTSRQWYRPYPPTKEVYWSLRNNTNLMQAGVLASLDYTARNGEQLLRNFWQKGVNSVNRGRTTPPYAFLIPELGNQRDPRRAAYLVNQLMRHGIEVHEATDTLGGSFVVLLDQPYGDFAVDLLTKQDFPSGARHAPYDDVAWTLGLMYGVEVKEVTDTAVFSWAGLKQLEDTVSWYGSLAGYEGARDDARSTWLLRYAGQAELLPALYDLAENERRSRAFATETSFNSADTTWPVGTVIVENLTTAGARRLAEKFGLSLTRSVPPEVQRHRLDVPRIAVYHTWFSTQAEGWVRYWFEQIGIPYTSIDKDDLRNRRLRRRLDVILVPHASGDLARWIHGVDAKWGPLAYTRTSEFPAHGTPDNTSDITGGMGFGGLAELSRFLDEGGTIITLGNAGRLAVESGLIRQLSPYNARSLFHPGSIVRAKARRPDHPIVYGFSDDLHVFRGNMPLWAAARRDRGLIVLQYGTQPLRDERDTVVTEIMGMPETGDRHMGARGDTTETDGERPRKSSGSYVLSGMVRNSDEIVGHGAVFDVPAGEDNAGRVIVFSFNPLHRFLNHHDAPLVFNAILNWNDGRTDGQTRR